MLFLEGIDLYDRNKYDEAIKCFDRAIELNPNDADGWYGKGNALYELKKYEEAVKCYYKATELNPKLNPNRSLK